MAEIAVSFLLDQLKLFLQEEARLLGGVRNEAVRIKDELEKMKDFVKVLDTKKETDKQLRKQVLRVQDVANDVEDVLDEFMLRLGHEHGDGFHGFLRKMACSIKNLKARHRIASELRKLKSRVEDLSKEIPVGYRIPEQGSSSTVNSNTRYDGRGDALFIEEAELVGIEKPKQQLISWLLDGDSRRKVVSVVGMGGLGKTTLVKRVFEDTQVKRQFQTHAWVTVSQSFDIVKLLKDIIKKLRARPEEVVETMSDNELKAVIKEFLQERRYVVVLDDVWSIDAWDAIKLAFPDGNCGSRVLLTTRVLDVASVSRFESRGHLYEMKALSDEESWTLFCQKTFEDKRCPQNLEGLSRNVLRKCEGLPLAIVAIGGVLALKKSITEWEMILRDLSAEVEDEGRIGRMKKILSLSYNDLPYHLKICYIYLSIFPEDYEIERKKVIRLWTSLRFVQERQNWTPTEVADSYIQQLLNRSLIQLVASTTEGKLVFRIHDLLRDIIISKSREQNILTVAREQVVNLSDKVRHIAFHQFKGLQQQQRSHVSSLRSLIMFDVLSPECSTDTDNFHDLFEPFSIFFGCCKFLKVIDASFVRSRILSDDVSKVLHLKYLCMTACNVRTIPKSVGELQNLEILDLKENNLSYLPVEIGNLRKLEILDVSYNPKIELPVEIGKLQKLTNLFVGDGDWSFCIIPMEIKNLSLLQKLHKISAYKKNGSTITEEIMKLTHLKGLEIGNLRRQDGGDLCSALWKLSNLRSLCICSDGGIIDIPSFPSSPPVLRKLALRGGLERVPHWIPLLNSLVRVSFYSTRLEDDPLQCLEDLPNLQCLLLFDAYKGEELCFKAGRFPRLKKLELWSLKELRWVRVGHDAMPHLAFMDIAKCEKLEEVPSGIDHLTKLGRFVLRRATGSLLQIGQHHPKLAHIPDVRIELI